MNQSLGEMGRSKEQLQFGSNRADLLPQYSRKWEVRFACNGECPKHRFIKTPDGEEGLNYLCAASKRFFTHIDLSMRTMARLLERGHAAIEIMEMLKARSLPRRAH